MKSLAKEHMCTAHGHRPWCGDGQREGGEGAGWRWGRGGMGDISNSVSNKFKNK